MHVVYIDAADYALSVMAFPVILVLLLILAPFAARGAGRRERMALAAVVAFAAAASVLVVSGGPSGAAEQAALRWRKLNDRQAAAYAVTLDGSGKVVKVEKLSR